MKRPLIKKGQDGIVAEYSLPEVEIYPQNRFGDIARKQGLQRARNWRKIKEGTTKGINDFGSNLNTGLQLVSSFMPVVSDVQDAKDFYNSIKSNNYTGAILASAGFIPLIGGIASNTNKIRNTNKLIKALDNKYKGPIKDDLITPENRALLEYLDKKRSRCF